MCFEYKFRKNILSDWQIHKSNTILEHQSLMIRDLHIAHENFKRQFPKQDSTWGYGLYNIFALTSPSPTFYTLYSELKTVIREYVGDDRPLWIQSWLNFHYPDDVLNWHGHAWPYHGYISIDPKKTKTVFENYEIINEVGNIYIGPGERLHKVEVMETFDTPRMTIGFDVHEEPATPYDQFSLVPLL